MWSTFTETLAQLYAQYEKIRAVQERKRGLLVALDMLLRSALHAAINVLFIALVGAVIPLQDKEVLIMPHHLRVNRIKGTAAERQIIDGI